MWTARTDSTADGRILKFAIKRDLSSVPFSDALRLWQDDDEFRQFFIKLLIDAPFAAYRWETPPLTVATVSRPFEFVLLDSPELSRPVEPEAFAEHFSPTKSADVVEFQNLGKDAILVVPCPSGPSAAYCHLASFVRSALLAQIHTLWKTVGAAMMRRLNAKPVWLSTAGAGVAWLHVRLDDRPKYYGYAPYRNGSI